MESGNLKMRLMLEAEKEIVKDLSESERYRYFLGRMQFIKYESGKENLIESDCSGSVCLALLLATGCFIRLTSDELFKKIFTVKNPSKDDIQAAFFITNYDRKIGQRIYKEGECAHVAGICGIDVVLNCVSPVSVLRSLSDMRPFYNAMDYAVYVRGLNRDELQKASDSGNYLFGADYEYKNIYKAINQERR